MGAWRGTAVLRDWVWAGWCALNIVSLPGRGALDRVGRFLSGTKPGKTRERDRKRIEKG